MSENSLFERAFFDNLTDWMAALDEEEKELRALGLNHYDRALARTYGHDDGDPRRFYTGWNGDIVFFDQWFDRRFLRLDCLNPDSFDGYGYFGDSFYCDRFDHHGDADLLHPGTDEDTDPHPFWGDWYDREGNDYELAPADDNDVYPMGHSSQMRQPMGKFSRKSLNQRFA